MARYRKIDPRIWNDEKFTGLSDAAKLVFFMLLTHPHMTALGAMRATLPGLASEMGWAPEAFREAFREASSKGMAEHDERACLIALPRFLKYNPPESPNVIKAWAVAVDLLPESSLKTLVLKRSQAFAEGMTEAFKKAYAEAFPKAMANQEQEQEQEQEKKSPPTPHGGESQPAEPKAKRGNITLADYLAQCRDAGTDPIPESDAVWAYPDTMGLPREYIPLAWWAFQGRYIAGKGEKAKRYTSWPQAFRNAVRENWLHLWWLDQRGGYALTTAGQQAKREMAAVEDAA